MSHPPTPQTIAPPPDSDLGDREVALEGSHLQGKAIALLICGSIAAYRTPDLARALRRQGATVTPFLSQQALRYVAREAIEWAANRPAITHLTAAAEHLSVPGGPPSHTFDLYLLAPATYNTIGKFRHGMADGVLTTTLASALGRLERGKAKILIAPTMHGSLHNQALSESIAQLEAWGIGFVSPRPGSGKHNLPETEAIVTAACRALSRSPLRHQPILVTGGPTPVAIDSVREITTRFTGRLGIEIASELYRRGAEVHLIHGRGPTEPPTWLPHTLAPNYDRYRDLVLQSLRDRPCTYGIFSAAVADYRPATVFPGKVPSGGALERIELLSTQKVIQLVREKFPTLGLVSFKYQEDVTLEELLAIAQDRLATGHLAVAANRGEETGPNGEQVVYLVTGGLLPLSDQPLRLVGKQAIAQAIADFLAAQSAP